MLLLTTPKSAPITSVPFNNFSDENGDDDGSKSDARCTYGLAGRNNMNMDFRDTDSRAVPVCTINVAPWQQQLAIALPPRTRTIKQKKSWLEIVPSQPS